MHQLRHTAPPRTAAEQSLPGHFQPHRTGDDRAAHGERGRVAPRHRFADYITAAAPDAPVSPRSVPSAAPAASPNPGSRSGPAAAPRLSPTPPPVRTALAGPRTAEPRCPQRPAVCPRLAARHPPPRRHPRRIPAAARPAAPRRSRCLAPSRPPQLPARLTEGAGSRAAPPPPQPAAPPPAPARRQGALLAPTYRGDEGPGRRDGRPRGTARSESRSHEAGLRRAASIGAAAAVRSAWGCKRMRAAAGRGDARGSAGPAPGGGQSDGAGTAARVRPHRCGCAPLSAVPGPALPLRPSAALCPLITGGWRGETRQVLSQTARRSSLGL